MNITLKPSTKLSERNTHWHRPDSVCDRNLWNLKSRFIPMHVSIVIPPVNSKETPTEFVLQMTAFDLVRKDLHGKGKNRLLKISEEKEEKENVNGYCRKEYLYNSFCHSFILPDYIKERKINAHYDKCLLLVHVSKEKQTTTKASRKIAFHSANKYQ